MKNLNNNELPRRTKGSSSVKIRVIRGNKILIRGAGELGSAIACSLYRSGFQVMLTEINPPLAIRRCVTFSDAILDGGSRVEDVECRLITGENQADLIDHSSVFITDDLLFSDLLGRADFLVDARMLKKDQPSADLNKVYRIGLGPGFEAGKNCHVVIETQRGHDLGRILNHGRAAADTGIPGVIGGESVKRVIRADASGRIKWTVDFGSMVEEYQVLGMINQIAEIRSPLSGVVRGLISPEVTVKPGLKIADVDPRGESVDYQSISDKSNAIARAVLEAVMIRLNRETSE